MGSQSHVVAHMGSGHWRGCGGVTWGVSHVGSRDPPPVSDVVLFSRSCFPPGGNDITNLVFAS